MSVDNPELETPEQILKYLVDNVELIRHRVDLRHMKPADGFTHNERLKKEALAALETYYKAQASKDLTEDHPSDIHKMLFTYGEVCEKEGALSPTAVEMRMNLSAYYSEYVWQPKTTASKVYKVEQ